MSFFDCTSKGPGHCFVTHQSLHAVPLGKALPCRPGEDIQSVSVAGYPEKVPKFMFTKHNAMVSKPIVL